MPLSAIVQENAFLIPLEERYRIEWTEDMSITEYIIGAYQDERSPFNIPERFKLVYSVKRAGVDLCVVYQSQAMQ